jgi:hypothetical protein
MKTRTGFVSNSSSSSFIVGFKKRPTTDYELRDVLFPAGKDGKRQGPKVDYGSEYVVDPTSASTIIFKDLEEQKKPLTQKQIREEIGSGYFEGYPQLDWSDRESDRIRREYKAASGKDIYDKDADPQWFKKFQVAQDKEWADERAKVDAAAKEYWKKVNTQFKGLKCYRFSYSDNDGTVFSTLEHGDTFRSLPHIRISHH